MVWHWRRTRRAAAGGQVVIPFLFALPCMFLFVVLLYETAKLSREKIRHQFATDSAAFAEMTHYSDFLNRSAYVNGAFPQILFREAFKGVCIDSKKSSGSGGCNNRGGTWLYDIIAGNGAFPRWKDIDEFEPEDLEIASTDPWDPDYKGFTRTLGAAALWPIRFEGCGEAKNRAVRPDMDTCRDKSGDTDQLDLVTLQNAKDYWITWDDAQDIYRLYVQVYQLLGSVAESQQEIFERLTRERRSYRKSYWLNSRGPLEEAQNGADWFDKNGGRVATDFNYDIHRVKKVMIYGAKPVKSTYSPYQVFKPDAAQTIPGQGLFQFLTVSESDLRKFRALRPESPWPGFPVIQHWDTEKRVLERNFFGVDFHLEAPCRQGGAGPCVHATAAIVNQDASNRGVWPDPTPKYQVRLYP